MKKINKFICIFFTFLLITGNMDVYAVSETLIKENLATVTEETKDEPEKKEQVEAKTEEKTEEKTTVDKPAEKPAEPKTSTNKTTESSQPPVEEKLFKLTVKNDSEAEFEIYQLLTVDPTEDLSWGDGFVPNKEDNEKEFEEVLQKAIEDEDITVFTDKYEEQIDKEKALETEKENLYEVKPGYYYLIGEKVLPQIIKVKEDTETEIQEKPEVESEETSEEASDEEVQDEQKEEVKEETEDKQDEEKKEESDKQSEKDVFKQTVDKTEITVSADKGIFPEGATLSVEKVEKEKDLNKIEKAIDEEKHVAGSFTYDIKILDKEGNEIQPEKPVEIAFANPLINSTNHETNVYHIKEKGIFNRLEAEKLENTSAENFVAKTDGFSYYTVEFTYNEMTYSMKGDTEIPLSTVLDYVGLTGTVSKVEGSNDELFSFAKKNDVWYVKANKAFQTDEWMKVTIDGIEYEIKVTDATTYRVEFQPMAGVCTNRIVTVDAGSSISSLPTPILTNPDFYDDYEYFSFAGWYTQPHGGTKVTEPYTPTADTILYAHWSYEREFEYTGAYQEWTAPLSGVYQIDITGGGGGYSSGNVDLALGGKGGSATGKATLTAKSKLYISIGGGGSVGRTAHTSLIAGGWNGGGSGGIGSKYLVEYCDGGGGGGATSVCTALRGDGQLKNYSSYTSEVLMVAGGGGGGTRGSDSYDGGHGGGTTPGAGEAASSATFTNGTFGQGTNVTKTKTSGITDARAGNGGGGGGYTGGKASNTTGNRSNAAGYGGTGYVKSTLSDASTTTGGGAYNEDGTCTISLISTDYDIMFSAGDGTLSDSYIYQNISPGSTCTLPTPTRSGYTFDGWYTATSGGTKRGNGGATYTPTQTETLYAHWSQAVVINFADQTATKTFSTSAQTVNITAATGGSGDGFTYSKQSGSFSVSGTSITIPANTEVGTYTTVVRATDSTSGSYKDATYTITINKANISPTVSMSGWTYGETASNPSVSGNPGSGTVTYQYKVSTADDSTYSTTKPSNAGTYTVKASVTATTNYNAGTATANFTISKAGNPLSYTATQSVSKTFSTSAQTASLTAATNAQGTLSYAINSQKDSGDTAVTYFSLSGTTLTLAANTPAGTYTVVIRATAAGNDNYNSGTKDSTITVTVGKANISPTVSMSGWTYGGTASSPSVSGNPGSGAVTYEYKVKDAADSTYSSTKPSNAGTYTVRATVAATTSYNGGTATTNFTISKATPSLTFTTPQTVTKTFSTSSQTASLTAATGNQGTLSYAIQSQKNSGGTDVTCFSLSGTTLTIGANAQAGTYTVVVRATDAGTSNYNSTTKDATVNVTINKATMTVTPTPVEATYDGNSKSAKIKVNIDGATVYYGDSTSYGKSLTATNANTDYTMSEVARTNTGTTTVYYKVTKSNYNDVTGSTTIKINNNTGMTLTPTAYTDTYDGSAHSAQIKSNLASTTIAYGTSTSYGKTVTAGTSNVVMSEVTRTENGITTVYYKGSKANYSDKTGSTTITINPKFTAQSKSVTYNPSSEQNVAITAATGGSTFEYTKVSGDFSISGTNIVVPAGTAVGTYSIVVKATDTTSGHNSVSTNATYTITVNKANMTVTPTAYSAKYDGSAHSAKIKVNVAGATVSYGTSTSYGKTLTATNANTDYAMSEITGTNVDTTTVYYKVSKANYNDVTGSTTITISKQDITPTVTMNGWTYGGTASNPSVSGNPGGGAVSYEYKVKDAADSTYSGTKPSNAGTYTVKATVTATSNYNGGTATANFTISKANNPLSYTSTQSVSKTFSTSAQTASLTAATNAQGTLSYAINSQKTSGGTTVSYFTLSGTTLTIDANTPVGTYTVVTRATAAGNDNYNSGTKDSTVTVTVNRANISPSVSLSGWTYGGTANNPSVSGNPGSGAVTYEYKVKDAADSTYSSTKPSNAGTYTVRATVAQTANYNSGTATANFTISKANNPLSYVETQTVSKTFSTSSQTASLTAATGNQGTLSYAIQSQKQGSTNVSYFTLSGTTLTIGANTPAGTYTVVIRATAAGNDNYNSGTKDSTITVTINKANISPSVSISDWTYGGTASSPSVSGNPGSGAVTYEYKVKGAADSTYSNTKPTNAGSYTVRASIAETANYNSGTATANFTISKANINPTVSMSDWTYGETASNPSVTGNSGNGAVSYEYKVKDAADSTYSSTKPSMPGSYTVKASIATTTNYNAGTATANFTIKEGTMTVTPVPYNAAYDKAAHSAQIKVNVAGATVQYGTSTSYGETLTATNANTNYAMSDVTRTNVGTTTVYYKVTKSGYKDVTGSTTITITDTEKPSVTITSTNNVASTQTVTIHATDNVGITAYYWGTKANPADSDYTEVTSTESFTATKTVNAEGKYYLFAKDGEGNTNSTNKEFYKTTFAVTHGSVTINTVITMAGNNFATPAITADTGYTAPKAWTKSTSGTVNIGANYTPEGNVNMTAVCTANTNTITLNPNGGTYNNTTENTTKTVTYDATTNNAVGKATRTGYDFDGWYLDSVQVYDANGNCTKNGDYWSAAGENGVWKGTTDLTLKAKWTEHTATLTYDANGHGTAPASVTMKYTEETKAASAITSTDGTFKCWNTKQDGSGISYNPGDTVKAANAEPADTTLYAQWDEVTPVPTGIPHKIFPFMGLAALALFAVIYKKARRKNKTNNSIQ